MSVIRVLPAEEAKKIAAGEVVERPASVVKELFENSIDAGANKISLHIEGAGKKLIRVVDDGCGMSADDAKLCFTNHATSKISSLGDLETIASFGFRGEALASISSVSKVTIETREHDSSVGVKLEYVDGDVVREQEAACAVGTDLRIKKLFYNTPVRQKFLRQDETEWNQIHNLFQAFCLSHLDKHFVLHRNGKMMLNAPPVREIKDRVVQLWGYNMGQNLIDLSVDEKGVNLVGLVSKHHYWRYGRQMMFFFVNGRWVKNSELSKALMKGYRNVLPPARFPAAFLFLNLDASLVDINVHPRKEEVRFVKPVTVGNCVHRAVTEALEGAVTRQLSPSSASMGMESASVGAFLKKVSPIEGSQSTEKVEALKGMQETVVQVPAVAKAMAGRPADLAKPEPATQQVAVEKQPTVKIIGQLLNTYIVIENDEGLLLIDQHAAHERILYETYLKNFEQKEGTRLLFPEIIKLPEHHCALVLGEKEFLQKQGIEVEAIGENSIAIKTSPPKIQSQSLQELIFEMIEFVEQNEHLEQEEFRKKLNEHMHGEMACKMAIKAGDPLTQSMMRNIVEQLNQVDNRFICVHGRPTTWTMSKHELEKTFRRK